LDELLPPTKRGSCFVHGFDTAASVKDVIEALGVPHTEIGLILINGESVDFSCPPERRRLNQRLPDGSDGVP
jgi:hypothetical protein